MNYRYCKTCGGSFERSPKSGRNQIYCSSECRPIRPSTYVRKYTVCQTCGGPLIDGKRYCSVKCRPTNNRLPCSECGGPTTDSRVNQLCIHCSIKHTNRLRHERSVARRLGPHQCWSCKLIKPPEEFKKDPRDSLPAYLCKACQRENFFKIRALFNSKRRLPAKREFSRHPCSICAGPVRLPRRNFCENCSRQLGKHTSADDLRRAQLQAEFERQLKDQIPKLFDLVMRLFEPKILLPKGDQSNRKRHGILRCKIQCGYKEARQLYKGIDERANDNIPVTPDFEFRSANINWPLLFAYVLYLENNKLIAIIQGKRKAGCKIDWLLRNELRKYQNRYNRKNIHENFTH